MNPHVLLTSLKTMQRDVAQIVLGDSIITMKYAASRINGLLHVLITLLEEEAAGQPAQPGKALSGRQVFGLYVKALASQNRFLQARSWEELQPDSRAVYDAFARELAVALAPLPGVLDAELFQELSGLAGDIAAIGTQVTDLRTTVRGYQSLLNDTHLMWWDANPDAESAQALEERKQALDEQARTLLGEDSHD